MLKLFFPSMSLITHHGLALHWAWGEWGRFLWDTQTNRWICCSINTLLKSHRAPSPGCSVTRCKRSPAVPAMTQLCQSWATTASVGLPSESGNKPPGSGEVPPIAESCHISSCCEKTSSVPNQCPGGHQTRLKHTKTKQGGIVAWARFL